MNKSMKKLAVIIALTITLSTVLSGCSKSTPKPSGSTTDNTAKLDPVTLKMYLLGGKPVDNDLVYAEVNKKLKEKIKVTLDVSYMDWGDWATKYPILFASGENFDLIYTANWAQYGDTATKKGFKELTEDMLKTFAPKTWADEPKNAWDQAKINGKIYMVPSNANEYNHKVIYYRGDLAEKYNLPEIKTTADLDKYMDVVAKNEKSIKPMAFLAGYPLQMMMFNDTFEYSRVLGESNYLFVNKTTDTSGKLYNITELPEYTQYLNQVNDWAKRGFWSKDDILSKTIPEDLFDSGKVAIVTQTIMNAATKSVKANTAHPDWKVKIADLNAGKKRYVNPYISNGMAIATTSKNVERSLMAIDTLRNDRDIFDTTSYGIKGKHWEAIGNTQFKELPDSKNFGAEGACQWGWKSPLLRTSVEAPKELKEYMDLWAKNDVVHSSLETFNFNDSNLKTEIAAINNVNSQYGSPLEFGIVDSISGLKTYKQKLKEAGIEKVMQQAQKQVDDYIKAVK